MELADIPTHYQPMALWDATILLREENIKTFQEMITVSDGSQFGAEEVKYINPLENAGPMFLQARRSPRMQRY